MKYSERLRAERLSYFPTGEQEAFQILMGDRLRLIRESLHLSQEVVADRLHITQSAYSKLETGATQATVWQVVQLARILNSPLLTIIPPPN